MQAVAAELSGYAGQFRCFLERRVLIAKKHSRTQEEPTVSRRGPHRSILAFLSTRVLECLSSFYFKELANPQ